MYINTIGGLLLVPRRSFWQLQPTSSTTTLFPGARSLLKWILRSFSVSIGERGKKLLQDAARATVPHAGVPLAIVDGVTVDDTNCVACGDGIMQRVCEAVRKRGGSDSPVCQGIFGLI